MTIKEIVRKEIEQKAKEDNGVKEKKFRFPFGKKVGAGQKKKNYVTTLITNENGIYEFKKYQIMDQTIVHDVIPRLASAEYVLHDKKGNPLVILPNWSVEPFSPLKNYNQSLINGSNTAGFRLLLDKMEMNKTDTKKKMGNIGKWAIGLVIAAIIGYALLSGGGV